MNSLVIIDYWIAKSSVIRFKEEFTRTQSMKLLPFVIWSKNQGVRVIKLATRWIFIPADQVRLLPGVTTNKQKISPSVPYMTIGKHPYQNIIFRSYLICQTSFFKEVIYLWKLIFVFAFTISKILQTHFIKWFKILSLLGIQTKIKEVTYMDGFYLLNFEYKKVG